MIRLASLSVLLLVLCADFASAQSFYAIRRPRTLIASVGTGTASYFGELKNDGEYIDFKPSFNLGLQVFISRRVSLRTEITWFQLSGDDAKANDDRVTRNLNFRSNNYEINATAMVNLTPHGRRYYQRPMFNLYAFLGVGFVYSNPSALYQGEYVSLPDLETEGVSYSTFQPVIPLGLGMRIKSGPFFNIVIEGGYRFTFTDYLDDVSSLRYPDPASLKSDLSRALSDRRAEYFASIGESFTPSPGVGKRGNPESNDGYFLLNVKLEYYLPFDLFAGGGGQRKTFNSKRKAFYRYNKRGGLKK